MKFSASILVPAVLALTLAITGFSIAGFQIYSSTQAALERELDSKTALLNAIASTMFTKAGVFRNLTFGSDLKALIIQEVAKGKGIEFIRLVDVEKNIVIQSSNLQEAKMRIKDPPQFADEPQIRERKIEGKEIRDISLLGMGTEGLWMRVNVQPIRTAALQRGAISSAAILAGMLLIFLLFYFAVRRFFLNPSHEAVEVVKKFGKGNLNIRISENVLLKESRDMAHALNTMMDRVKEQREREQMLSRMKTEFISIAAHQLRTPLSAIKWTFQMLLAGDIGKLTKEQRDFISRSNETNERMIELINDLLNVSRIEEGKFGFRFKEASLIPLIQDIIDEDKVRMEQKNISFELKGALKKIPALKIDAEKITMVFSNLLDNAIKYTLPGGRITVTADFTEDKQYVLVSVQDTGVGMPEEQMNKLFTKFFRGRNAMLMQTEGTGLGLFLVKNIIEQHGGKIWAESEEGKGSTFYFTLPLEEEMIPPEKEFRSFVREF